MSALAVSVAIQHHPRRAEHLQSLLAALPRAQVVVDPDPEAPLPSPWRTYRHALERTPLRASHRLVLQDDAIPCPGFGAALERAVRARPDQLLSFFLGGEPASSARRVWEASGRGEHWAVADPDRWLPTVALCWPAELARSFLAWDEAQAFPDHFRADDERVGRFARAAGATCLVSVPNLVEHEDKVPSLVGQRARAGLDPARVSCCPPDDGCDPATIDWTLGPS